jgi:hypothetical protein
LWGVYLLHYFRQVVIVSQCENLLQIVQHREIKAMIISFQSIYLAYTQSSKQVQIAAPEIGSDVQSCRIGSSQICQSDFTV